MSVRIVSRREWGATTSVPGGRHIPLSTRRWFVVHWPGGTASADGRQNWRNIEAFHRDLARRNGWSVVAPFYNFGVMRRGGGWEILEGCGRDVRGIHSPPRNTDGFGVMIGVSIGEAPPAGALRACRALYDWLNGQVPGTLQMGFHGQHIATACPGPALTNWVRGGMRVAATGPTEPTAEERDRMTPDVAFRGDEIHASVRRRDGAVMYRGPITDYNWRRIGDGVSISGVSVAVSNAGRVILRYINRQGQVAQYNRDPGRNSQWQWSVIGNVLAR